MQCLCFEQAVFCQNLLISFQKFGIRLGYAYYKNKLRLTTCLRYANLKYQFKNYSGIPFLSLNEKSSMKTFVHNRKQCTDLIKKKTQFLTNISLLLSF